MPSKSGPKSPVVNQSAPTGKRAHRKIQPPDRPMAVFRLRITAGELIAIGPGKIALLESIEKTGSLTSAAKMLDMSYRRAWLLLDEVNRSVKQPAVESSKGGSRGGGSRLTELGRQLVTLYRRIERTATRECAGDIRRLFELLSNKPAGGKT